MSTKNNDTIGATVFEALLNDPKLEGAPDGVKEAFKPFALELPNILGDLLSQKVTLETFMKAKITFMENGLKNGLLKAIAQGSGSYNELTLTLMQSAAEMALEQFKSIAENISLFLDTHAVTEQQVLLSPQIGFSPTVIELYKTGELTIRELIEIQPGLIVLSDQN